MLNLDCFRLAGLYNNHDCVNAVWVAFLALTNQLISQLRCQKVFGYMKYAAINGELHAHD